MDTPEFVDGTVGRTCSMCHQVKPLAAFTHNDRWRDGYNPRCRECMGAQARGARAASAAQGHARDTGTTTRVEQAAYPVVAVAPHAPTVEASSTLAAPRITLEEWILAPPDCPVSCFITPAYCIVRVMAESASYWLLRPQASTASQPDTPLDDGWLVALLEMLDASPHGWVFGKSR